MNIPSHSTYAVYSDMVFEPDARRFAPRRIEIQNGTISSVEPLIECVEEPLEVFDLRGLRILPPLTDSHVHLYFDPWPLEPDARKLPSASAGEFEEAQAKRRLGEAFHAGVGVVRDLGDPLGINLSAMEWTNSAHNLPRLITSGPGLFRNGRYGRFIGCPCEDRTSLLAQTRELLADSRVHLIKVVATGIINFKKGTVTGNPPWETEDLRAVVDLAHESGIAVAAHGSGESGIRRAVEAGVDFIEHGYFISKGTMEELRRRNLVWTPTFAPVHVQWNHAERCGWNSDIKKKIRKILDGHAEMVRFAQQLGVRMLAGSDAGAPGVGHGGGLWQELWLLEEAGIHPITLLRMATSWAADWMGLGETCGRLIPGRQADFIAVDGPLECDLRALNRIRWVVRNGCIAEARKPYLESDPVAERYGLVAR